MRYLDPIVGYSDDINNLIQEVSTGLVEFMNNCDIGWEFSNYYNIIEGGTVIFTFIRKKKLTNDELIEPRRFSIYISPNEETVLIRRVEFEEIVESRVPIKNVDEIIQLGTAWVINLISEYSQRINKRENNE
jgi:hypothetical protein